MTTHQHTDKSSTSTAARANKSKLQTGAHPAQILQRLESAPGSIRPADVLVLQRTIGNRATGRLLQTKLKLGPAGDKYEQEADRVAQQVVHASRQPDVQRADLDEEELQAKPLTDRVSQVRRAYLATAGVQRAGMEEEELQAKRTFAASPPLLNVQRADLDEEELQAKPLTDRISQVRRAYLATAGVQRAGMEEEELQAAAKHGLEGGDVDTDVARSIESAKGGGAPLHDGVRSTMEQALGADFSGVRVHAGGEADALNRSLDARAFTTGNDIFFGSGEYNPGSSGGQELIAHELTHTVQQGAAGAQRESSEETIQRRLTKRALRAFTKAKETDPKWGDFEGYTDLYMPTKHQDELSKLRSLSKRRNKSPEDEKRLKDYLRAVLLSEYAVRLEKLENGGAMSKKEASKKREFYFGKAKDLRDKLQPLVEKGVAASETQAFLMEYGFTKGVAVGKREHAEVLAKGPRLDVRSTFIGGSILGINVCAHLFIVYTARDGRQMYFRGGPNGDRPTPLTVANYGPYSASTVDYDPSAPSVTVLEGPEAEQKLDALIEATSIIDGMRVPYQGQIGNLLSKEGENCNATAWTILTRAGIKPDKPSGRHPGWGGNLGSRTEGKQNALPEKESFDVESATDYKLDPKRNATDKRNNILIYSDRELFQVAARVGADFKVGLLDENDRWRRIVYNGQIGYLSKVAYEPVFQMPLFIPPVKKKKAETGRKLQWYYGEDDSEGNKGGVFADPADFHLVTEGGEWIEVVIGSTYGYDNGQFVFVKTEEYKKFVAPVEKTEESEEKREEKVEDSDEGGVLPEKWQEFTLYKELEVLGINVKNKGQRIKIPAGKRIVVMEANDPKDILIESENPGGVRGQTTLRALTDATTEVVEKIDLVIEEKKEIPEKEIPVKEEKGIKIEEIRPPVNESELTVYDKALLGMLLPNVTTSGHITAEMLKQWGLSNKDKSKLQLFFGKMSEAGYLTLEARLNVSRGAFIKAVNEL